ncbi:MAG: NB-ARC domain-containing protein [Candidatus Stygibacter australis]|nr:NB-ARC domain-containing protein [Candidatus Stygibacter australis]
MSYDIESLIKRRDISTIATLMFEKDNPILKNGYKTENELWDYKQGIPENKSYIGWAEIAKDILGFHNNKGGLLIFGINDKSFQYKPLNDIYDSKSFNDKIRKYVGDLIWVEFYRLFIDQDQNYLGIAVIPPRGPKLATFVIDSPVKNNKLLFLKNGSALRDKDSTRVLNPEEAISHSKITASKIGNRFFVDEDGYRLFTPEFKNYIERDNLEKEIISALKDPRYSTISIIGIGGVGKTATATSIVMEVYYARMFAFIVSFTAKDRELTQQGIQPLIATLNSFENLLDNILDVMNFPEFKKNDLDDKRKNVLDILEDSKTLLFVDNLETVEDERIIEFLNEIPVGTKALVTSRRSKIKFSVYPINLRPFNEKEYLNYIQSISSEQGFSFLKSLTEDQMISIGESCDGIPLAIRWILSSSQSVSELLHNSNDLKNSGRKGEELLEFSFRRVFDKMDKIEIVVMKIIAVFAEPVTREMIIVTSKLEENKIDEAIDNLLSDTFIYKIFDDDRDTYTFTMLSILKKFISLQIDEYIEELYRRRMTEWFNAEDVRDPHEKALLQQVRQSNVTSVKNIIDLHIIYIKKNDIGGAEKLLLNSLEKYHNNYKILFALAELYKKDNNIKRSLEYYEKAVKYTPSVGREKALINREYAFLLRKSGRQNASNMAIDHLEISLENNPDDRYALTALATLYSKIGKHRKVIELVESLCECRDEVTVAIIVPLLKKAYNVNKDILKLAEMKRKYPTF